MTTPDLTKAPAADPTVFSHLAPGASTQPGYEGQDAVVITVHPDKDAAAHAQAGLILMVVPTAQYVEYTYPQGGTGATSFVTTPRSDELPTQVAQLLTSAAVQDALAGALAQPTSTPKEATDDDVDGVR